MPTVRRDLPGGEKGSAEDTFLCNSDDIASMLKIVERERGISVAERTTYIGRVRNLARLSAEGYLKQRERMGFPLMGKFRK